MFTPGRRRAAAFTLIELLVVIAIIAILIGLLLPAVQKIREAAARTKCQNNVKQLALALHNFHSENGRFPPADTDTPVTSWTPYTLPYIEQMAVYSRYDFSVSALVAPNDSATDPTAPGRARIPTFMCPSDPSPDRVTDTNSRTPMDYMATCELYPVGRTGGASNPNANYPGTFGLPFPPADGTYVGVLCHRTVANNAQRTITDVTDGTSNTIMLGECAGLTNIYVMGVATGQTGGYGSWANPQSQIIIYGCQPATGSVPGPQAINCTNSLPSTTNITNQIYSFHSQGANVAMADGSVRFLQQSIQLEILIALVTRAYSEVIPNGSY